MEVRFDSNFNSSARRSLSENRSYAILGTGALGGFYGARLQQAGIDVHFLLRSDYEYVKKHGLFIESPDGTFRLPQVNAYRNVHDMPCCDVIVVALKTTQNNLLRQMLPCLVKDNSVVLVLQNGLGVEEEVAGIVGSNRVMGGLCFTCNDKVAPGHFRHLHYGVITLAEYAYDYLACGITKRMLQVKTDFERAGILIQLAEDLLLARWKKLICNIPFNGLTVVLNATIKDLISDVHTRALVEEMMQEMVTVAAAYHRAIADDYIEKRLKYIAKMGPYRTSTKIDFDYRRSLEVEAIFGNPLRAAQQAGIDTPQLAMLYRQLKFLDTYYCTDRAITVLAH
jgi:2-dehydropantoate 2-reductase